MCRKNRKLLALTGGAPYLTAGSDQFILTDNADMPDIKPGHFPGHFVGRCRTLRHTGHHQQGLHRWHHDEHHPLHRVTPDLILMPTGVNLAPNELQKQIFIGVADNVSVDTHER